MITPLDVLSIESWILLGTTLVLIRYYMHRRWQVLSNLGIPHDPPSVLGIGNMTSVLKDGERFFVRDLENKKKFGNVHGFYWGLSPRITIWDPDVLKEIQIKRFSIFRDRQRIFQKLNGKYLNEALTSVSGDHWKRIRNSLSPTFSTSKLKEMFGILDQCSDNMIERLSRRTSNKEEIFDIKEIMGKLSLDVICSAAFGVDVHSQEEGEEPKVLQMAKKLFQMSPLRNIPVIIFLIFPPTEKIGEFFNFSAIPRDITNYFGSLTEAMIKHKVDLGKKAKVDLLKGMLEVEIDETTITNDTKGISRLELIGNSILMLLGGYETTSSALLFLSYNLAVYKDCQEKLRRELKETIEQYGSLSYEAINSMKYLMMCVNESLRLYPPTVRNVRFCEEETTIKGIRIPKDIHVEIPIYGMARDPENWENPEKFKPERFEDMTKIDPIIFQPFGAGPRNCIGMRFALMEIKMAICKTLQNFQLDVADDTPEPPLDIIVRFSMRPKVDVLNLRVTPLREAPLP